MDVPKILYLWFCRHPGGRGTRPFPSPETGGETKKICRREKYCAASGCIFCLFGISLIFVNVALSELYFVRAQALVKLKNLEAQALDENETLKIDVERLRSPERITSIAEKKLGMQTARSNIYVRE